MRDIWNPWHGCRKKSSGCKNCYMYYLDKIHGLDGFNIYKVKSNFNYPIQKDMHGNYKVKSGEKIRVCMTSDFFLEEADEWRKDAYDIMEKRKDVVFWLLTKRPERVKNHLPKYFENIAFNVTCENQEMCDERIPILLDLPFKHKGIMVAPFIGKVDISKYLKTGKIEYVCCDGENYENARPLNYEWVKSLYDQCKKYDVTFEFFGTGNIFIKNNKKYRISSDQQGLIAYKSGLQYHGKKIVYDLKIKEQMSLFSENENTNTKCNTCNRRFTCSKEKNCEKTI